MEILEGEGTSTRFALQRFVDASTVLDTKPELIRGRLQLASALGARRGRQCADEREGRPDLIGR